MTIVVLDAHTLNPGDLDWAPLEALGDVIIYPRTPADQVLERAENAEIILTNKIMMDREMIAALPALRYIGVLATGYNIIDCEAAKDHNIIVTNVPAYSTDSVAQTVFAHILHHASAVAAQSESVHAGDWVSAPDFSYQTGQLTELRGKVLGIIGFGAIGGSVADIAKAFGMRVIAITRTPKHVPGVQFTTLDGVLRESDFISLHCPLTNETEQIINAEALGKMKSSTVLINTGRGALLDEQAVADSLNARRIAGAGLDVLSTEPPEPDNPLLSARNCSITPHTAWATREARTRLLHATAANVKAFQNGSPKNVVN